MSIDRLLARFSIQTKVIVFIVPLIGGIIAMAAINLYTGSLLGGRLMGTSASIESLSGFKQTYSGMTEFLQDQNAEKRAIVMQSLDDQLARMEDILAFADTDEQSQAIARSRATAEALRGDVDRLWQLQEQELAVRDRFGLTLAEIGGLRTRLEDTIATVGKSLADAEAEAKSMLRSAEQLGNGAQTVVTISSSISGAQTPEAAFAAASGLRPDIETMLETLPPAVPSTQPAVRSLIEDNMAALLATMDAGVTGQPGMIELQKYANALRPTGIKLQGLAAQVARQATVKFGELDQPILEGQEIIAAARGVLARLASLELSIVRFMGEPSEIAGSDLSQEAAALSETLAGIDGTGAAPVINAAVGPDWAGQAQAVPALVAELTGLEQAHTDAFAEASGRIDEAWNGIVAFAGHQQQGAEAVQDRASDITLSAVAGGITFGLLAAFLLVTALKGPIIRLVSAMRGVASGDLDVDVTDSARADEIGEMARALDIFKHNALDKIRIESESEDERHRADELRRLTDTEKAEADRQLSFAVQSLGAALRNLARGNLVTAIDTPFAGDLDALRLDFNESVERMRAALIDIRTNAVSIEADSAQLRTAADDLARRTEQQAASLEQTASAVEEISATVHTASERATDTDRLAQEASHDARESGAVVGRAVDAMGRIEEASENIGRIIGVIDEIAFQTNLLALNAGVEAARAGEAGKGFAVVAQEVRDLAGRSATAAREIKQLIEQSGTEVRSGVALVGETGEAITRIIARIENISGHVSAMATASREQSAGLDEVNTAVGRMDKMTQQNAAMVEETNAASHALATEAAALNELVGRFRLDADGARALARPAPAHPGSSRAA
ncbi:methyl-accepting chemotaxis protein [Hoeflea sp.]|uniref:methyl-accepting chemotaxis protein n=1 Tax=Hoeflea sp. TaxID=1940281 RepID=UPI003BAF001C